MKKPLMEVVFRRVQEHFEEKKRMKEIDDYVAERDAAFENDDLQWAKKQMPLVRDELVAAAFHKARLSAPYVSKEKKMESIQYLRDNGFKTDAAGNLLGNVEKKLKST